MEDEIVKLEPLDLSRVFASHPRLETERLILRATSPDDAEAIFDYASDPIATEFMIFQRHQSIQESIDFIKYNAACFEKRERLAFAISLKESDELIGTCDYHHIAPEDHRAEIGYILRRKFWGQGYATEVTQGLIRFGFDVMGLHRLEAICNVRNVASARVLEKAGMQREATFRDREIRNGKYQSGHFYAILQ